MSNQRGVSVIRLFLLSVSLMCLCACPVGTTDGLRSRAVQFYSNMYSGQSMQEREWLTDEALSNRLIASYGGLSAAARDCSKEAQRNQGLKSVEILGVEKKDGLFLVEVSIIFMNNVTSTATDAWVLQNDKWKITYNP